MISWAVETLVATTLLMLLVLAIRNPVRRAFGPGVAYALWALPALRLLLPPMPESWREGAATPLAQASETIVYYVAEPLGLPAPAATETVANSFNFWPLLLAAWTIGAIGFIAYHLIAHHRFCARVRAQAHASTVVADGNVEVIETDAATGPLAFGVWRKYVAFPRDFAERYDPLERDLALAHELGHHARGDLIANWAALVVLALHWFNPIAWHAFRAFRADQEMACDALVLGGRAHELRHAYGRAIVKSAHGGAVSAACHLHTVNDIKGRLRMLTKYEGVSRGRLLGGGAAVVAVTLAGLGLTASGTHAAERVRQNVEKTIGVDLAALDDIAVPTALAPIAAPAAPAPVAVLEDESKAKTAADEARKERRKVIILTKDKDGNVRKLADGQDFDFDFAFDGPDGKRVEKHRFVFRDKDGNLKQPPVPPMPPEALAALKNMPEIASRECRTGEGGDDKKTTIESEDGEKRRIVICTNRIERLASLAQSEMPRVVMMQRRSFDSGLMSLRRARSSVEAAHGLSDDQRRAALNGIDEAIRDMEKDRGEKN